MMMTNVRLRMAIPLVVAGSLVAAAMLTGAYSGEPVRGGGVVRGVVRLAGPAPRLAPFAVTQNHDVCGRAVANEEVVTGAGGALANGVGWIDGIARGAPAPPRPLTLDQRGCRYVPHVQATTVGSPLTITSSDATLHNTHAFLGRRTAFNLAVPIKGMRIQRTLGETGILDVKCDAGHTWMRGYVHVFEHPYFAVSGSDGRFELREVPPGHHAVKAWHERFGVREGSAHVEAGGVATWDVSYR